MGKKYTVKDLNKNGKIDGWEQGKYDAINSATPMKMDHGKSPMNNYKKGYYSMKMGSKQINSPSNFSNKSAMLMSKSPMYQLGGDPSLKDYGPYADPNDPMYIGTLPDVTKNQMANKQEEMNQQYKRDDYNQSGGYNEVMYQAGLGLGKGLKDIFKPKPGSQAEKHQQDRKAARKEIRKQQGGTNVGNALRKVFRSKKVKNNIK
jgi:hypothetical protein